MGWKETYASKLTSMDEAAKVVKSGDTVIIAHAVGEPVALVDKMVDYAVAADLHDIKIHQLDLTNPQNDPHRYQQHCEDPLDHKYILPVIRICSFLSALLQSS